MQKDFTYSCARCAHSGDNRELACYNCGHKTIGVALGDNYTQITCLSCGIDQGIRCPKCDTQITWKTIELYSEMPAWLKITLGVVAVAILKLVFQ